MKFDIWVLFENAVFIKIWQRIMGILHEDEDQYTFLIVSRSVLSNMWNISDKTCRENQNTYFMFSKPSFFKKKSCCLRDMGKNIVESVRPLITVWCMHIAHWITKATLTQNRPV
jgi:hypothetical protein